jgi:ribonuclease III
MPSMSSLPEEVAAQLGVRSDLPHLEEALTHPSGANEQRGAARLADNQRLEFLGDAVLGLCVSELLMNRFPLADEGELSLKRASLVNTDALAAWARSVQLGTALHMGRGADAAGERNRSNVLADAVEALVGAIYVDLGLESAREITRAIVAGPLDRFHEMPAAGRDAKSELQERVQARGCGSPVYRVVAAEGPAHERRFTIVVEVSGKVAGTGQGRSKKLAEREAARAALATFEEPATELVMQHSEAPAAIAEPLTNSGEPQ